MRGTVWSEARSPPGMAQQVQAAPCGRAALGGATACAAQPPVPRCRMGGRRVVATVALAPPAAAPLLESH